MQTNQISQSNQNNLSSKKCIILMFLLIYFSKDTLLFGTNINRGFFYAHIAALVCICFFFLFTNTLVNKKTFYIFTALSFLSFSTMVTNSDTEYIKYIYVLLLTFIALMFTSQIPFNLFIEAYQKALFFLSVFAILLTLMTIIAPQAIVLLPTIVNTSKYNSHFALFGCVFESGHSTLPRAYSIFREPGVFSIFVSLALINELFHNKKNRSIYVLIFVLSIVFTFSTAGYIVVALILLTYLLRLSLTSKKKAVKRGLVLLLSIVIIFCISISILGWDNIHDLVFEKLNYSNESLNSRFGSVATNLLIFSESPLFGKGWQFVENNFYYYSSMTNYIGLHNTNTLLKCLSVNGIIYFTIIATLLYFYSRKICKHKIIGILLFIIIILIFSNEDLSLNIILYILAFYGVHDLDNINYKNE